MLNRLKALPIDGFVLLLLAVVATAAVFPASGTFADVLSVVTKIAIALLFLLYGARLSPADGWAWPRNRWCPRC
jgi:solute carrier family 10 (sodium/bile acid cotransporter), member 7